MRSVKMWAWAGVVGVGICSPTFAQTTTTTTNLGTTTSTTGGGGGGGGGGQARNANGGTEALQLQEAPMIQLGEVTGSTLNSSNSLGQFYANPYFQGRSGTSSTAPGGFGSPLYTGGGGGGGAARTGGATTGGARATAGAGSATAFGGNTNTAARGATGGFGGTTGGFGGTTNRAGGATGGFGGTNTRARGGAAGGFGGTNTNQAGSGVIIPLPQPITYTAQLRFPSPAIVPAQMQTDLRGVLDRSSMIRSPGAIQLSMDAGTVVLRGNVADAEEASTAEGMIRLTPGVKLVRNELKYPNP